MLNSGDWDTYPPEGSGDRSLVLSATKLDAKEEAELRILVASSLRSDESDRSEYSSDSSTAAIDAIDVADGVAAVITTSSSWPPSMIVAASDVDVSEIFAAILIFVLLLFG